MQGEVLGVERRRRWDDDQKLAIVSSVGVDGATVTQMQGKSKKSEHNTILAQRNHDFRHESTD
ncbi:MAG: hypothetical protein AB7F96_05595 [Beijerinckiaceae bacterium]